MGTGTIEKKFEKLPDNLKLKVEGYIDALLDDVKGKRDANNTVPEDIIGVPDILETPLNKSKREFGGLRGIITYMADDFDAPLEDFKDYM